MKPFKILLLILLTMVGLVFVGAVVYLEYAGPPTDTVQWKQLPARSQRAIEQIVPPLPGETYLYYYSLGVVDFAEDGNLITDQRVVSYARDDGEHWIASARYEEIRDISVEQGSHFLDDTVITVHHEDEELDFALWFSIKRGLDRKIVRYIRDRIASPSTQTEAQPADGSRVISRPRSDRSSDLATDQGGSND